MGCGCPSPVGCEGEAGWPEKRKRKGGEREMVGVMKKKAMGMHFVETVAGIEKQAVSKGAANDRNWNRPLRSLSKGVVNRS